MAAQKFLALNTSTGGSTEIVPATSGGGGDADKIPALDASGQLAQGMMPTGVGPETQIVNASEILAAGDFVNFWDDAGTVKARKADATTDGKRAHGFVIAGVAAAAPATVYVDGANDQLSSLTLGARYFLDAATAGGVNATAPSTAGNLVQALGVAVSATTVVFKPSDGVTLA